MAGGGGLGAGSARCVGATVESEHERERENEGERDRERKREREREREKERKKERKKERLRRSLVEFANKELCLLSLYPTPLPRSLARSRSTGEIPDGLHSC